MNCIVIIPAYRPPQSLIHFITELQNRGFIHIILVDDGSEEIYQNIFEQCRIKGITVLRHSKNKGKGEALKTAFHHCLKNNTTDDPVITIDCDGQHRIDDIEKLIYTIKVDENAIYLGARKFDRNMPLKSRLGNTVSAKMFRWFYHLDLCDTQTGLRAFPARMLPQMLRIPGSHYEYEANMLIHAAHQHIPIRETEISCIYKNKNKSSHYRPLLDSLRVTAAITAHVHKKL